MRQQAVTVSAVLIVKDEEAVLAACLESVAWADEIVVYDTGSTDRTREIARQFTDIVVEGYWDDDFAAARNRALAHATSDWVLSIDADEVFEGDPAQLRRRLGALRPSLVEIIQLNPSSDPTAADLQVTHGRIFPARGYRWAGALHEQITADAGALEVCSLAGVRLRHGGNGAGTPDMAAKLARNTAVVRRALGVALAQGSPQAQVATLRMQLARSLAGSLRLEEASREAEDAWATGLLGRRQVESLATTLSSAAAAGGDFELAETWLSRWEAVAGNVAWVYAQRARVAAQRADAKGVVDALGRVPTTTVNAFHQRLDRRDLAGIEVRALAQLGRRRDAVRLARTALGEGRLLLPVEQLADTFGDDDLVEVVGALRDEDRRDRARECVMHAGRPARRFLEAMEAARPGDPVVLGSVVVLTPALTLEEAAAWSARLRSVGRAEACPLVAIGVDTRQDPRQRAIAAALAYDAYGDERALPALEEALAGVAPEHEDELAAQLDVVAPGLVGRPTVRV